MFTMTIEETWNGDIIKAELDQQAREISRRMAEFVAERARSYCPVKTGRLRASIHVVADGQDALVVADAPHSAAVELGHRQGRSFVPAQPFLEMALADARRELPNLVHEKGGIGI